MRRIGTASMTPCLAESSGASRAIPSVPSMGPGITELIRTPSCPHSRASVFVIMSTPALAAHTCTCMAMGTIACGAEMLITLAPGLVRCAQAARITLKVPSRSMSTTDLNPLGLKFAAAAGKLPAAPDTSTSILPCLCTNDASASATA